MNKKNVVMLRKADNILIVNKDFEVVYNSRFDSRLGNTSDAIEVKDFFAMYPSLRKNNSSIAKTMSTGVPIFQDAQEWSDINNKVYVTQNLTIPIIQKGKVEGVIELTNDLTTVGDVEHKHEYLTKVMKEGRFPVNTENGDLNSFEDILTVNNVVLDAIEKTKVFAINDNPVLIYGETGTGKELFAQAMINYSSFYSGKKKKVIIQNCAAVPENLMESILFGTTKGSYTGAENRKGLFEEADGGIFFLDELNAMPYSLQGKLLRVVQEGTFRPIGSSIEKKVNVKIIAAMNIDPMEAIEKKILRKDLFYRLSGNMIYLPPLRERPDDIEFLTNKYIEEFNEVYDKNVLGITPELKRFFLEYEWDGNVRELKHIIESMISLTKDKMLKFNELPVYLHGKKKKSPIQEEDMPVEGNRNILNIDFDKAGYDINAILENAEREIIIQALRKAKGNKTKASEMLGIPRQTLKYRITKLGCDKFSPEKDEK